MTDFFPKMTNFFPIGFDLGTIIRDYFPEHNVQYMRLLEIGPGDARRSIAIQSVYKFATYVGVEPHTESVELAREQIVTYNSAVQIHHSPIETFSPSNQFHIILFVNSFHCIKSAPELLNQLGAMLKENGIVVVVHPKVSPKVSPKTNPKRQTESDDSNMPDNWKEIVKKMDRCKEYLQTIGSIHAQSQTKYVFVVKRDALVK
jgi:trans-aconitate methyltransferase